MNTFFKKRVLGFTTIELMIVIVIVALLLALAYPSYINYTRKAKRGEAQQLLMNWAVNQEIFRSNNTSYATLAQMAAPTGDYYNFDTNGANPTATAYTLRAQAQGDQANDKARDGTLCTSLTIDQSGQKLPASCWE
ncbi:MAG: prepilin-type N-terminal cleavage/methylation domain-containing protein [Xanthomonadales bacterium]|nr:prepilin-type N-terminal cleavage/methylation domain-containing protein [Gammaproteobacteria bacterium]NNJ64670.1 prepilin-type N-terminal cleavage/methylation domain-containing protein [Xanthomonadales bacterium]NNK33977.1 prepilin-type N-terminal cleavage/methylation domain-containing protein [Xanthomonadales bacterium]